MSRRQREYGRLSLNKSGFNTLAKTLRGIYNARQDELFAVATALHNKLSAPGVKPSERAKLCEKLCNIPSAYHTHLGEYTLGNKSIELQGNFTFIQAELFRGKNGTLTKPRQSAFNRLKNNERSFTIAVTDSVSLRMNEENGQLVWSIEQGNRSVDRAYGYDSVNQYLAALREHPWKRGEGGEFVVTEENLSDDPYDPSDVQYVSASFGVKKAERKR